MQLRHLNLSKIYPLDRVASGPTRGRPPKYIPPAPKMIVLMSRIAHQLFLGTFFPRHVAVGATTVTAPFVCTPIDLDVYGHMNNANYVRVAELARWRMLMESGLFRMMSQRRLMFLVVSQEITYGRPIAPFQAYVVRTAIRVCEDDKWVYYTHTFEDEVPRRGAATPVQYAKIVAKTVMKEPTGKTVRPSEVADINPYYQNLVRRVGTASAAVAADNK